MCDRLILRRQTLARPDGCKEGGYVVEGVEGRKDDRGRRPDFKGRLTAVVKASSQPGGAVLSEERGNAWLEQVLPEGAVGNPGASDNWDQSR